jgi:hypothetical protein
MNLLYESDVFTVKKDFKILSGKSCCLLGKFLSNHDAIKSSCSRCSGSLLRRTLDAVKCMSLPSGSDRYALQDRIIMNRMQDQLLCWAWTDVCRCCIVGNVFSLALVQFMAGYWYT